MRALCEEAVHAALATGAAYADARVVRRHEQEVRTRNGAPASVTDRETEGIGVRVLAGGCWGFACDRVLTPAAARSAAAAAAALARAGAGARAGGAALAPAAPGRGSFRSVGEEDPIAVSVDEKLALCLAADEAMRAEASVVVREALVRAQREHRVLVSSEGAATDVETAECGAGISATAAGDSGLQTRSYPGG
jgi:TldD protein